MSKQITILKDTCEWQCRNCGHKAKLAKELIGFHVCVPEKNGCTCPVGQVEAYGNHLATCPTINHAQSEEETYRCCDKCPWHQCPNAPKPVETHSWEEEVVEILQSECEGFLGNDWAFRMNRSGYVIGKLRPLIKSIEQEAILAERERILGIMQPLKHSPVESGDQQRLKNSINKTLAELRSRISGEEKQ
jgi:hypothetical protein